MGVRTWLALYPTAPVHYDPAPDASSCSERPCWALGDGLEPSERGELYLRVGLAGVLGCHDAVITGSSVMESRH